MPGDAPPRRSCPVQPRGGESRSAWRLQRSMAAGSGSPWSSSHTVRVAYWKVSTAVAGAPQPGRAQRRGRNIRATYRPAAVPARMAPPAAARYGAGAAYHGKQ